MRRHRMLGDAHIGSTRTTSRLSIGLTCIEVNEMVRNARPISRVAMREIESGKQGTLGEGRSPKGSCMHWYCVRLPRQWRARVAGWTAVRACLVELSRGWARSWGCGVHVARLEPGDRRELPAGSGANRSGAGPTADDATNLTFVGLPGDATQEEGRRWATVAERRRAGREASRSGAPVGLAGRK
jgi:hypothetical protein